MKQIRALLDLKKLPLPPRPKVIDIQVDPYVDQHGVDSLKVWVILDDDTTRADRSVDNRQAIRDAISKALLNEEIDLFPYTRIATQSEFRKAGVHF